MNENQFMTNNQLMTKNMNLLLENIMKTKILIVEIFEYLK